MFTSPGLADASVQVRRSRSVEAGLDDPSTTQYPDETHLNRQEHKHRRMQERSGSGGAPEIT